MVIHAQQAISALPTPQQSDIALKPDLRGAMRSFATGVCVATTYADRRGERRHDAVTINSLTSISLDPPLVSVSLRRESAFLADLLSTKRWAVSILDGADDDVARQFSHDRATRAAAIDGLCASPGPSTGALVLDVSSWLECVLWERFDIGDHTMVVGEVVGAGVQRSGCPLIFLHGRYHALPDTRLAHSRPRTPRASIDASSTAA